jgi:hypothetical protein
MASRYTEAYLEDSTGKGLFLGELFSLATSRPVHRITLYLLGISQSESHLAVSPDQRDMSSLRIR